MSRCSTATPRRTASARATTRSRGRTATACCTAAHARCGTRTARCGTAGISTARRWTPAPRRSPGEHDFTAFTPTDTYHTRFHRIIQTAEWRADGDLLEFWITADTFMRSMIRILVGTMLEVATGRRTLEDFIALLEGAPRTQAGPTAAAHGLALASVGYPPAP